MELLEWAVLPWMQRRERISGQGEAVRGGDAWPQRTGSCQGEAAHQKKRDPTMFTPSLKSVTKCMKRETTSN